MRRKLAQFCTFLLLAAWAVPVFAGKILAEVEYFYADDGTLTGRAVNGKRVNFEYDRCGQLLAVKDAQGRDLERYTYDPAGNRLSKTVGGVTTTYVYDEANQLVSSTVKGVTTNYKYDAAGRLIKEGGKSYSYGWLNKVLSVTENGQQIASFNYHNDGQVAKAIYGGKVEQFLWDGLALIQRGETAYVNEPYVTGGNPVLAGDDVLFNDMLGSTLSVNGNPVDMTSFGETADSNAFFTGKPYIGELGYAFLFRAYDPAQGKWTTSDPLGYPDGWNNLAYCNNRNTVTVDFTGLVSAVIYGRDIDVLAQTIFQHSYTTIVLTATEYDNLDQKYKNGIYTQQWNRGNDETYNITLSAYEHNNMLEKRINDPKDSSPRFSFNNEVDMTSVISVLDRFSAYNNQCPYEMTGNNCNAFTNTIWNGNIPKELKDKSIRFISINSRLNKKYFE